MTKGTIISYEPFTVRYTNGSGQAIVKYEVALTAAEIAAEAPYVKLEAPCPELIPE